MTKVNCRLKVNWKYFRQKFLQFTLLIANHVLWVNSIVANESQLEHKIHLTFLSSNWLSLATIEFTQSTWFAISKVNCKIFCRKYFQFTLSLQIILVIYTWSDPKILCIKIWHYTSKMWNWRSQKFWIHSSYECGIA